MFQYNLKQNLKEANSMEMLGKGPYRHTRAAWKSVPACLERLSWRENVVNIGFLMGLTFIAFSSIIVINK